MLRSIFATLFGSLLLSLVLVSFSSALSKSSPVQLSVPDTILTVDGYGAPGALVTVRENGSVIGTVTADSSGFFTTSLSSQASGLRTLDVYYDDGESIRSQTHIETVSVLTQQETIVTVFLSPTITRRTTQQVQKGSLVQISGYTAANATVTLGLDGRTTQAASNGFYQFLIDSSSLSEAAYSVAVTSALSPVLTSDTSKTVGFNVASTVGPTSPDIVVSPDQLPPPTPLTPGDGSVIDGESVVISGDSVPNAQINIYENGVLTGSIFADSDGKWSFEYAATSSPVTLSFEACIDGRCSVLSATVTLTFTGIGACRVDFHLLRYRFWGLSVGEKVALSVDSAGSDGLFEIDWGDGVVEKFDYDIGQPPTYSKSYIKTGNYSGNITFYAGHDSDKSDCSITRYFSVQVTSETSNIQFWRVFWLFIVVIIAYFANHYFLDRRED